MAICMVECCWTFKGYPTSLALHSYSIVGLETNKQKKSKQKQQQRIKLDAA